jgi:hypothetical protein
MHYGSVFKALQQLLQKMGCKRAEIEPMFLLFRKTLPVCDYLKLVAGSEILIKKTDMRAFIR